MRESFSLEQQEDLFQHIIQNISDSVSIIDSGYHIRFINQAGLELYGYTRDELQDNMAVMLVHPDYQHVFELYLQQVLKMGQFLGETIDLKKNGTAFFVESRGTLLTLGEEQFIISISRDMTEHRNLEADLKASQKEFEDLYENAPDIFLSVDVYSTEILQCNNTFLQVMGYEEKKQVIGKSIYDFYHVNCHTMLREVFKEFSVTGDIRDKEVQVINSNGRVLDMSLNATAVRDRTGKILHSRSIWRDISRRKAMENELRMEKQRLEKALEEIKTLKGLLPICSSCKKIRDDQGYWKEIEDYIGSHSDAQFSHGICPDCARKLYPDIKF